MAEADGKRRQSIGDWEQIDVKPPIDLIPDEFPRESNRDVLVELVCSREHEEAMDFKKYLETIGYSICVTDKDRAKMSSKPDWDWLEKVIQKTKDKEYQGLIMVFAMVGYSKDHMKYIWSKFTSKNCPQLKNKPKIFIFQIAKTGVDRDSTTSLKLRGAYDTPSEADILIIHDKYDPDDEDFLEILTTNIEKYGCQEDLMSLLSMGTGLSNQPMMISTMTRKFFFELHQYRGLHLTFHDKHEMIKKQLDELKKLKSGPKEEKKKVKKMSSFRNVFKKWMPNHNDKKSAPTTPQDNEQLTILMGKATQGPAEESKVETDSKPLEEPSPPMSLKRVPTSPIRKSVKQRNSSVSAMTNSKENDRKPPWR